MKKIFLACAMVCTLSLFLFACSSTSTESASSASSSASSSAEESSSSSTTANAVETTVTVAMPSAWSDMFPLGESNYYERILFEQVYDTLIKQNSDGTYVGDLAETWEVNADSTQIVFTLYDNVVWHDGEAFTAKDVVESMKMYSDPEINATSRYFLEFIAGCDDSGAEDSEDSLEVEATGDYEVTVTLKEPTYIDTVLDDLSKIYILAAHKIEGLTANEINNAETWAEPMGTGPFIYADAIDGERMEFTANEKYFLGAPEIDNLVVRVVESSNLLAGLMNGEIDTVLYGGIPLDDWAMAQEQSNLTCVSSETTGYQMLIFNASKEYMTQEVREALNIAINRDALVDQLLQGEGQVIVTPISPINLYYNADVEVVYDPDKAKEMLEEAGFDFSQTLTFAVPTGNTVREKAATMIAEDLKSIGVQVEIQQADFSTVMADMKAGESDLGIVGSGGTLNPSESLEMLTGSFNLAHLSEDNELAQLLQTANSLLTYEERQTVYDEFQEKMVEICPYGYLFTTNNLVAYNNRLGNVDVDNFGTLNFGIYTWTVSD